MTELSRVSRGLLLLMAASALVVAAPGAADAQAGADVWLPFLGCWQADDAPADAPLTCIRPLADGGIEMLAVADDGVLERRTLRADGAPRSTTVGDCPATETASQSADGLRVYVEREVRCDGEAPRGTRGIIAMVERDRWVEVEAMEVRGESVAWATGFVPAPRSRVQAVGQADLLARVDSRGGAVRAARMASDAPITVDAVIEAYRATDAEAVRAWIAEQVYPIPLDADGLRRLAAAGVPDDIIDVVVAVAYPEQFEVARTDPEAYPRTRPVRPRYPGYPGYWDPYFGYWGRSYWGAGYWGWGGYGRFYSPRIIVVTPRDGTRGPARAVQGRGYTRGTASPSGSSSATGSTSRTPTRSATPRSNPSSGDRAVSSPRPSSRQPAASSGSSGSSSRTAEPRRTAKPRGND